MESKFESKIDQYNEIPIVSNPKKLKINLFRHQLASIHSMEKLEKEKQVEQKDCIKETRIGINADHTGYGKTLSMIGLIVRDKMEWNIDYPFVVEHINSESEGLIRSRKLLRYDRLPCNLILVSPTILKQWEKEFEYTDLIVGVISTKKDIDIVDAEKCDVVLVTTSNYNDLIKSYSRYAWKRFIFDEPGHNKVIGMKNVQAGFYWLVTATPSHIISQHRNGRESFMKKIIGDECYHIEEQFDGMIIKNDLDFVKSSFSMPPVYYNECHCFQPLYRAIIGLVSDNIKNMIEADNIEGAIESLGGTKTKNILELVKQKLMEELENIEAKIRIYNIRREPTKIEEWRLKKELINNKILTIENRVENMISGSCNICLDKLVNPIMEPSCHNLFCGKCILTWLQTKQTCPLCRQNVVANELVYLSESKNDEEAVESKCENRKLSKQETIVKLIKDKPDSKFIIFSSYDQTFDQINSTLTDNNINFSTLRGSIQQIQKTITDYKEGDLQVIFLNSKFTGSGINLQETTDIILYHDMSESTKTQLIGRANRIGRTLPLYVHQLRSIE
jgi:hypothetical protein